MNHPRSPVPNLNLNPNPNLNPPSGRAKGPSHPSLGRRPRYWAHHPTEGQRPGSWAIGYWILSRRPTIPHPIPSVVRAFSPWLPKRHAPGGVAPGWDGSGLRPGFPPFSRPGWLAPSGRTRRSRRPRGRCPRLGVDAPFRRPFACPNPCPSPGKPSPP